MKRTFLLLFILLFATATGFAQFQLLDVDGIEVRIDEIRFFRGYSESTVVASIKVGQTVNLTGDLSDVFTAQTSIRLEAGEPNLSFDTINIQLSGGVGIKGHTYLEGSDTHIYTTLSGIGILTGNGATWSEPSDYAYLHNDYMYYEGQDEIQETTFMGSLVTFSADESVDIELLVDTFQVAYYWDGEESTRHGFVDSWHSEDSSLFPSGTEVVGISYLPLYVSVNQELTAETYIVAIDEASLTPSAGGFYDQKTTMTMTLVFDADGSFFIGRTANWDGLSVLLWLPQYVTGAALNGTDYDLTLESYDDGWTDELSVDGFTRLAVGETDWTDHTSETGTPQTLYFKRVKYRVSQIRDRRAGDSTRVPAR